MAQELKPGTRWISATDDTEVIVVRGSGQGGHSLECGGTAMLPAGSEKPNGAIPDPALSGGTAIGKRFGDDSGIELLCTKGGIGSLSIDGVVLVVRDSKPLPSSD